MMLRLERVGKQYSGATETVQAVSRLSLSLEAGEIVVLYGPSGAGKSTLLLLAAGVLKPDEGRVLFNGQDLADLSQAGLAEHLREHVGVSYQDPQLLAGHTVRANAAMKLLSGPTSLKDAERAVLPWLAKTGLGHRLDHYPNQLSGGERQRAALARALTGRPSLLLLDEPTARLDSHRASEILRLVADAAADGTGVLLVTHDHAAERIATRVVELRDGELGSRRRERAA